jgi:hypothetical protein
MLPQDVDAVGGIMQMRTLEQKKYFSMLPVGYAIVKLAERFHSPFLIRAPMIDIKKNIVTDDDIRQKMRTVMKQETRVKVFEDSCKVDKLQAKIASTDLMMKSMGIKEAELRGLTQKERPAGMYNWSKIIVNHIQEFLFDFACKQVEEGFAIEEIKKKMIAEGYNNQDIDIALTNVKRKYDKDIRKRQVFGSFVQPSVKNSINAEHIMLLNLLQANPGLGTAEVYTMMQVSGRKGNQIKKELVDMGLIFITEDRNVNGWTKRLQLTEQGSNALNSATVKQGVM